MVGSPTRYFVLTGMVLHIQHWQAAIDQLIAFRKQMRTDFGLLLKEEIHAGQMLSSPGPLVRIRKNDRLTIIRRFLDQLATMRFLNFINVRIDKQGKEVTYDPFKNAWKALIQRFENTLVSRRFPGPSGTNDLGVIFCDQTDDAALRRIYRRMRVHNPVSSNAIYRLLRSYRQLPITRVIEEPSLRRSHHSYFIQTVDVASFATYQRYAPSAYVRKKGAKNYFNRLDPVLCKVAATAHPLGIVEL